MSGDLESLLRYQPHAGRPHERNTVARHLRVRGIRVTPEQVLIVDGAQHGLAVTMMALLQPGDVIAADALTYSGFKVTAEALHLEILPIPLQALDRLCRTRRVRAVYSIPTLHNPLGWVLDLAQREQLVALARRHDLLLIEDGAYAFLAEDPPAPLIELAPERTIYVSGLSKNVATGLRVGFVAAPLPTVPLLQRAIRATARLETEKRRDARARQVLAAEVLAGLPCITHPASYFLWLPLAEEARADRITKALLELNVAVSTAEPFAVSAHVPHALRLALGSVEMPVLRAALEKVRWVVEAAS